MFHSNTFTKITSSSLLAFMALGFWTTKTSQVNATNQIDVSVELMLSIDVSGSVDTNEYNLQMDGYAAAFRDDEVISTIESLPEGLAVTAQFWATLPAPAEPWRVLKTEQDSKDFADYLDTLARPGSNTSSLYKWYDSEYYSKINRGTNLTGAISAAKDSIINNQYDGDILVIDVSGDGKSNGYQFNANNSYDGNCSGQAQCQGVENARDVAVGLGITVNGLPIEANSDSTTITDYYNDHVKGGTDGFVETATSFDDFTRAATEKISMEIKNAADELGVPDANPDTIVTNEHTAATYNVIAGDPNNNNAGQDNDPDGDNLTVTKFFVDGTEYAPGDSVLMPSGITFSLASNGDVTYNPVTSGLFSDYNEGDKLPSPDEFTYVVTDTDGYTNSAKATLDIHGIADSPIAADNSATTDENTAISINVLENDTDPDTAKENLTITEVKGIPVSENTIVTLSSGATVQLKLVESGQNTKGKHTLEYNPLPSLVMQLLNDEDDPKQETFTYVVTDDKGKTDTGSVTINVTGITDTFAD